MNPKKGMIVKSTLGVVFEVLSVENGRVYYRTIESSLFDGVSPVESLLIEDWMESSTSDTILSPGVD